LIIKVVARAQPLLEILGWNLQSNEVVLEYPIRYASNSVTHSDYALVIEEKPVALVEAKPFNEYLSSNDSRQIISYGKVEDIKWVALTNGKLFKIFNTEEGKNEKNCLIVEINLENLPTQSRELSLFSRESILTGEIKKAAQRMNALKNAIQQVKDKKTKLEKEFKKDIIDITGTEIESRIELISSQLVEQTIQLLEKRDEEEEQPSPPGEIKKITRKELSKLTEAEVMICPSRIEGVDFLKKYKSWGFVNIGKGRDPKYFALYVGAPESSVKYFAEIQSITQPLESKEELNKILDEDTEEFEKGKQVINLKPETLVELEDQIPLRHKRKAPRGCRYSTLKKLIDAESIQEL